MNSSALEKTLDIKGKMTVFDTHTLANLSLGEKKETAIRNLFILPEPPY